MKVDKALVSHLLAALFVVIGLAGSHAAAPYFLNAGLFALSGTITNALAIHMLFERVPGLYGSGVVVIYFEEIKIAIREVIMEQFFSGQALAGVMSSGDSGLAASLSQRLTSVVDDMNFDKAFDSLTDAIMTSSMGSMLGLVGGVKALDSLREPFAERMRSYLKTYLTSEEFQALLKKQAELDDPNALSEMVERLVDARLAELTPQQVKSIVQTMMRRHLGWLVVWGGVFGGLLGLLVAALRDSFLF
ncbi:hypothetical protein GCM10011403_06570 [Pseudohongiella nitratireducens]|uniref:DUF445 domain-containing protein n=1 Tax=Pseudohongiella nitratireducens TaxID=1768907 RepID=A0A917LRX3_9GAMM|nr:hypothetical protein [Pseudohongiella nitratireducens]MDF1622971.1 DUF445 domain-containing protein [Pseudohongiella nitratireducens]GGG52081.1 hypothetical protein GCM10011403_06570 [Pseudohongiella nitratireducens]